MARASKLRRGEHKKLVEESNRKLLLRELAKKNLTFTELKQSTGFSSSTLTSHLKKLEEDEAIFKDYDRENNKIVYKVIDKPLTKEIIIHDFVNYIGANTVEQILRKEMGLVEEIDLRKAFAYGTIESFVEQRYKRKPISYREILDILKEEYGEWIEIEEKNDVW